MRQRPGVAFQHAKQPLHGAISLFASWISSTSTGWPSLPASSAYPATKLLASFRELLFLPFGLPLISKTFILALLELETRRMRSPAFLDAQ